MTLQELKMRVRELEDALEQIQSLIDSVLGEPEDDEE